jgi:sugar/nucleoside kinase (ribokinase family)
MLEALKSDTQEFSVVVMPDFFQDRLLDIGIDYQTFVKRVKRILDQKGGSIDCIKHTELRGGNAINTASTLAALGVRVTPIISTDTMGARLIKYYLHSEIDLSHIKKCPRSSMTTAMEFQSGKGKINVMLRDVGSLEDFGPDNLDSKDYDAIEVADYVCLFNWAGTRHFGTELAESVFRHVKNEGKGCTYLDTADPLPNHDRIPELVKRVLMEKQTDILSVNENEAFCYASQLDRKTFQKSKRKPNSQLAIEAARILSMHLQCRVDLHTAGTSASFSKGGEVIVPSFDVPVLRATGAGDAWHAGNVLGYILRLPADCRLILANAVAAYYISSERGMHPDRQQLSSFLTTAKCRTMLT